MSEFNPKDCPIGITNEKNVEKLGIRFDIMMQRLDEKMDEMKNDIASLSKKIDKNSSEMDKRFDTMEEKFETKLEEVKRSVPDTVDEKIENYKNKQSGKLVRWLFSGVIGGVFIALATSIVTAWVKLRLGL